MAIVTALPTAPHDFEGAVPRKAAPQQLLGSRWPLEIFCVVGPCAHPVSRGATAWTPCVSALPAATNEASSPSAAAHPLAAACHSSNGSLESELFLSTAVRTEHPAGDMDDGDDSEAVHATLSIDLRRPPAAFPHYWKRSFGSGHALLATRADWQAQLRMAVSELGLEGLRFHGTFDDDMSVVLPGGTAGSYNYYNVDRVCG